jgi:hypothetical protein
MPLTPKQLRIVTFVRSFLLERGFSPSYQEIANEFGYRSLGTVEEHVRNLEAANAIRRQPKKARSIEIVENRVQTTSRQSIVLDSHWLEVRCDTRPTAPAPEMGADLAAVREYRKHWQALQSGMHPGDELWTFCTPAETWRCRCGRAGYALVREGEVVDGVVTYDQLKQLPTPVSGSAAADGRKTGGYCEPIRGGYG